MPISQVPFAGISNPVDFRNIVINGDMQIAQRSTSVASITTDAYHTVDRFQTIINSLGTWTQSQSTDVPSGYGFATSLKMDCTTADATPSAGDYLIIRQLFEGQNLQYLKKGTANALPLTASFWVKSTKTGTFIVELYDNDNNRDISKSYTVNTTNTWEFKTITFPGDTTGAFDNDNSASLQLRFWLGAGSNFTSGALQTTWGTAVAANQAVGQVNAGDSTSNDWLITGVQLEAGEQASGFEFMPVDIDLARCQRYYQLYVSGASLLVSTGGYYDATTISMMIRFNQTMRTTPSLVSTAGTNYYLVDRASGLDYFNSFTGLYGSPENIAIFNNSEASGTAGTAFLVLTSNASSSIAFSAEL